MQGRFEFSHRVFAGQPGAVTANIFLSDHPIGSRLISTRVQDTVPSGIAFIDTEKLPHSGGAQRKRPRFGSITQCTAVFVGTPGSKCSRLVKSGGMPQKLIKQGVHMEYVTDATPRPEVRDAVLHYLTVLFHPSQKACNVPVFNTSNATSISFLHICALTNPLW